MTLDALIMVLGAFVATLPFLGFPIKWDTILMVIAGLCIVVLGIIVRRRGTARYGGLAQHHGGSYVENAPPSATDGHEQA